MLGRGAVGLRPRHHPTNAEAGKRRGVTTLEVILVMPIMLIFLAAVIEFGLILAQLKHVGLASRVGAKVYAETQSANLNMPMTANDVKDEVDDVLATADMTSCRVVIEDRTGMGMRQQDSSGTCDCDPPMHSMPTDGDGAVRVTVCVELAELTPDFLSVFGFSTSGRFVEATTTYPYEDPP